MANFQTCRECGCWQGRTVKEKEWRAPNGDMKKYKCLAPPPGKKLFKRPDGKCWKLGVDDAAEAPESVTECACSGKEVLAIVEIPGDATPEQVDAAFDSLQSQLEEGDSFPELDLTGPDEAEIQRLIARGRESIAAGESARIANMLDKVTKQNREVQNAG